MRALDDLDPADAPAGARALLRRLLAAADDLVLAGPAAGVRARYGLTSDGRLTLVLDPTDPGAAAAIRAALEAA